MTVSYDGIIVGGGIVGLATAFELSTRYPSLKLAVFEKENMFGHHQTGHNSGVIHSGLYYKPGSFKAKLSVRGRSRLLEFCQEHKIKHELCGKIVVATTENEVKTLKGLWERGQTNGLKGLEMLDPVQIASREPNVRGLQAILVPEEGIIDYKHVIARLAEVLSARGVRLVTNTRVNRIEKRGKKLQVLGQKGVVEAGFAICCAGLQSDRLARHSGFVTGMKIVPFRGEYYKFKDEHRGLIKHLVYPVPDPSFPFLGVHFTRMIDGEVECGPNAVLAYDREGYKPWSFRMEDAWESLSYPGFLKLASKYWRTGLQEVYRSLSKDAFVQALRKMMPSIEAHHIDFAGSGIRAQAITHDGNMVDDFYIRSSDRQIHVLNAPSPAATASLAIGEEIVRQATQQFSL